MHQMEMLLKRTRIILMMKYVAFCIFLVAQLLVSLDLDLTFIGDFEVVWFAVEMIWTARVLCCIDRLSK